MFIINSIVVEMNTNRIISHTERNESLSNSNLLRLISSLYYRQMPFAAQKNVVHWVGTIRYGSDVFFFVLQAFAKRRSFFYYVQIGFGHRLI